jgi:hypothetical protein
MSDGERFVDCGFSELFFRECIQLFTEKSATNHRTYLASKFNGFGNEEHR